MRAAHVDYITHGGAVMKPYQKVATALVLGAIVGGAATQAIHAQTKPAYVVLAIRSVIDAANYKTVTEKAPAVVAAAGGRIVVATNAITSLDGKPPQRFLLISFDSAAKAQAWYDSPAMKDINAMRIKSTDSLSFIVEATGN
jgi:uncharacterized protein (DUF1330 family)